MFLPERLEPTLNLDRLDGECWRRLPAGNPCEAHALDIELGRLATSEKSARHFVPLKCAARAISM